MRGLALAIVPILALIVATGAASSIIGNSPTNPTPPEEVPLETDAVALPSGTPTHPLPSSTPISLTLTLSDPHSGALAQFLASVESPTSPAYRHFVSYPRFVEEFSPPESSVARIAGVLESYGGRDITSAPDRTTVTAVLSAAAVDQLLGIDLVGYGHASRIGLYTALGTPLLPSSLAGLVSGIGGLSDLTTAELATRSLASTLTVDPGSTAAAQFAIDNQTGQYWFVGSDYTQAYGADELFPGAHSVANATYPRSVAVATLLASAFNQTTGNNLPPWDPSVISAYFNGTLNSSWPVSNVTGVPVGVDGVFPPLPGSFGSLNDSTSFETENSLDLEMAGSLAPGAALYNFYFAGSLVSGGGTIGDAADDFAADLAQALAYDYSSQHLVAVSCSFGLPDLNDSAWDVELLTAAATGVTIVTASGDQGDAPDSLTGRSTGQWPGWPATAAGDLSGSLSVGGVTLNLSGTASMYYNGTPLNLTFDPHAGSISSVSAWYDTSGGPGLYAGTEGGVSTVYPEPFWQFYSAAEPAIINATLLQGASVLGRTGPDLAMPANATLATVSANATGAIFFEILEGTSIAAPVLAGLLADVVAVENNGSSSSWTSLGFVDPAVYTIANYFAAHPGTGTDPLMGVTRGSNYVFSAAPGWNPTTGWGGVNAPLFLAAVENSTILHYVYVGPTPGLPPGTTGSSSNAVPWVYIYTIFGVGIVAAILVVALAARPSRPRNAPAGVPSGAQWGAGNPPTSSLAGSYPGATFLCPYCGAIRPAEPVRCPQCGVF